MTAFNRASEAVWAATALAAALYQASHVAIWVDLERLSPSVLRHLAAAKERATRPRYDDTEAMAEELAAMLTSGRRPTIGWYRRHIAPSTSTTDSGDSRPNTTR
jgi:hypothetical protein